MCRLPKKTQIIIRSQGGVYPGSVLSAENYGTDTEPNWYIEFHHENPNRSGGPYGYWKQAIDGGTLEIK